MNLILLTELKRPELPTAEQSQAAAALGNCYTAKEAWEGTALEEGCPARPGADVNGFHGWTANVLGSFDAAVVLDNPIIGAATRKIVEEFLKAGKPVYYATAASSRLHRVTKIRGWDVTVEEMS